MKKSNLQWFVLATVIVGTFLGRLDQTIVNLALPKMIDYFGITVSSAGWIATAYILANAVFVPIWGKLGDTIGRKKVYIIGFIVFIAGSVLAGLAWNLSSMIVFRVIQAIASSADYPTAMAILAVTFTDMKSRAQALGIWSSSFAAASVFGPLIGGPLIDNFGWRSIFLVNLPVGLIGLAMALAFINESVSEKKTVRFDWWGATALGGALGALVLVLDKGLDWGWLSANSLLTYAVVLVFSIIFFFVEKNHPEPIVDFKFFKNSVFNYTLLNNFIIFLGLIGSIFLIPIFAQTFLGMDATQSGYLFIPMAFMLVLAAPLGVKLIGKVEARYIIAASTAVAALGMYLFTILDPRSTAWAIIIPLGIMAFGMGFGMSQRTTIIANVGTILQNATEAKVLASSTFSRVNSSNPAVIQQAIGLISLKAQVSAYGTVFVVSTIVVAVGAVLSLLIRLGKNETGETKGAEVYVE